LRNIVSAFIFKTFCAQRYNSKILTITFDYYIGILCKINGNAACSEYTSDVTTRNTFCGTWYLPHSQVHNERTVPIIMAGCIAHARNDHISTSDVKSDVTIVFLDPDFLKDTGISVIRVH